jgi:tetratricopeptide (TPR) repeat protein
MPMTAAITHTKHFVKKLAICLFGIALSVTGWAQQNDILVKLIKEGIALHDKGEYEAAIAKFDRALILDPNDFNANYEKSSTLLYAGKFDESIVLSKFLIENYKTRPAVKGAYINLGSAYDDKGNADSAIIAYDEGLQSFPDFHLLWFNKGLTQARLKKWDEAHADFFKSLEINPAHAGSLYYAALLEEKSNKVAAIISGLVFLAAEPEGKRAKSIFNYVADLLNSYVKAEADGGSTIHISMDKPGEKQTENNFRTVEVGLALSVAVSSTDTLKIKTDTDRLLSALQIMTETFVPGQKEGKGIFWKTYVPFFIEMKQKKLLEPFAHIASITSGNEENVQWISENQEKLKEFYQWMDKYEWKK